ncbi:AraC-like DNA-binding protein [Allocatelliglobosispora scoriae]|uniref:AraC-like DNA-binding protein n=1 Tax=Allocatelliglobosispora scoriae TaxID=643052 RepID=A0A841BEA3_9ACTN|nr:AraC family transcriptional regulator [Allocatelliglobosispora scoriae]MBB5867417.1 AraC-like DNA-binding protein [Allocatelliglobosispora scoriae]
MDEFSEVFDLVEARGQVTGAFAARGRWVARSHGQTPLKLTVMVRGRARLSADGLDAAIHLEPGDVAILNNRSWIELEGGTGDGPPRQIEPEVTSLTAELLTADPDSDLVVGGRVLLNPAGQQLLLQALPPVGHVRASAAEATRLRAIIGQLVDEVTGDRMGSAFAIRQYTQLLVLEVLRAYVGQTSLPPGRLRVLTDERLRPAVSRMHAEPGRSWKLEELAHASAMSRTSFAERFRQVAGVPPLTYLNGWRMLLAQRALRDGDVRIGSLAVDLGYSSESAFSTAFKREVGESPMRYRHRVRAEQPAVVA